MSQNMTHGTSPTTRGDSKPQRQARQGDRRTTQGNRGSGGELPHLPSTKATPTHATAAAAGSRTPRRAQLQQGPRLQHPGSTKRRGNHTPATRHSSSRQQDTERSCSTTKRRAIIHRPPTGPADATRGKQQGRGTRDNRSRPHPTKQKKPRGTEAGNQQGRHPLARRQQQQQARGQHKPLLPQAQTVAEEQLRRTTTPRGRPRSQFP